MIFIFFNNVFEKTEIYNGYHKTILGATELTPHITTLSVLQCLMHNPNVIRLEEVKFE